MALVYLYLFLEAGAAFDVELGWFRDHGGLFLLLVAGGIFLIVLVVRIFWRWLKKTWEKAKQGAAILVHPKAFATRVLLPQVGSYAAKVGVICVFLAAYSIPVTFDSVMSVIGSSSAANMASVTPGAVGVTQAANVVALSDYTDADTATAYSLSQQLVTTAVNMGYALLLVVLIFGWTGGKLLVSTSYSDAKVKAKEMKDSKGKGDGSTGATTASPRTRSAGSRARAPLLVSPHYPQAYPLFRNDFLQGKRPACDEHVKPSRALGDHAGVPLDRYRDKRDPSKTPEPFGGTPGGRPRFVVQRHAARRLHYDFRLERDGVLASWAIPKGIPLSTGERHLAVHVEDHPLDYADFEGEIPAGQYGAGTVEIWDRGTYEQIEEKQDGGLTIRLQGARLEGLWTLVPAALDGDPRNWLLLRKDGGSEPRDYAPMLATSTDALPIGAGWAFEPKWDGFRALARISGGVADPPEPQRQRPHASLPRRRPRGRAVRCARRPPCSTARSARSTTPGARTSGCLQRGEGALVFVAFDLIELDGEPLAATAPTRAPGRARTPPGHIGRRRAALSVVRRRRRARAGRARARARGRRRQARRLGLPARPPLAATGAS